MAVTVIYALTSDRPKPIQNSRRPSKGCSRLVAVAQVRQVSDGKVRNRSLDICQGAPQA